MTKLAIAEAILAAREAAGVSDQVEPKLSKRGRRAEGRKADPMKAAVLADAKSAGISPSTVKRAMDKSRGTDLTSVPKAHIDNLAAWGVEGFTPPKEIPTITKTALSIAGDLERFFTNKNRGAKLDDIVKHQDCLCLSRRVLKRALTNTGKKLLEYADKIEDHHQKIKTVGEDAA